MGMREGGLDLAKEIPLLPRQIPNTLLVKRSSVPVWELPPHTLGLTEFPMACILRNCGKTQKKADLP